MNPLEWSEYRELACDAARAAAKVARRYRRHRPPAQEKAGPWDLVTAADHEAQVAALAVLRAGTPQIPIVAEEGADPTPEAGLWWLVDPIDGTTNFVHGLPYFCASVALVADGLPVVGAVADPSSGELFHAARGFGARLGRTRIRVDEADGFASALLSSRVHARQGPWSNLSTYGRLAGCARGTRNLGSAALELAYVACGRLSAYWELRLQPWDYAAGALLVSEAGGRVSRLDGTPLDVWQAGPVVSSNGRLHDALLTVIAEEVG